MTSSARSAPASVAATIETLYAAFNRRDIDAVLASLHPDVAWPNGWEGGVVVGHDAVRDYWTRQWAAINPSVTPETITADPGDRVVVEVRQVVRDLDGSILSEGMVEHIYLFETGLVRSMQIRKPT
jgi:ketosteroid isomerase-like protein